MAEVTQKELKKRLRALEAGNIGGGSTSNTRIDAGAPTVIATDTAGRQYYDSTNNNLYLFNDGSWQLIDRELFLMWASEVRNYSTGGRVGSQADVTGFSEEPFDVTGQPHPWQGFYRSAVASTDSTDYTWENTLGIEGEQGVQGPFRVFGYACFATDPTVAPIGGNYTNTSLTLPTGYTESRPTCPSGESPYEIFGSVNPAGNTPGVKQIENITTNGISGAAVTTEAITETGFFDVRGNAGTIIEGVNQTTTVEYNGLTGEGTYTPPITEVNRLRIPEATVSGDQITAANEVTTITGGGTTGPAGQTSFSINGGSSQFSSPVTGNFTEASDGDSQETQMKTALDTALAAAKVAEKGTFALAENNSATEVTPQVAEVFTLQLSGGTFPVLGGQQNTGVNLDYGITSSSGTIDRLVIGNRAVGGFVRDEITINSTGNDIQYLSSSAATLEALAIEFTNAFQALAVTGVGTSVLKDASTSSVATYQVSSNLTLSRSGVALTFTNRSAGLSTDASINFNTGLTSTITVDTQGSGVLTTSYTISGDNSLIPTDITGSFTSASDRASQLTQMKTAFDAATTNNVTGIVSGNDFVLTDTSTTVNTPFSIDFSDIIDPVVTTVSASYTQGFTTAITGSNLVLTSVTTADQPDISAAYTGDGTVTVGRVDGVTGQTATTYTISTDSSHHTPSTTSGTITDASTASSIATQLNTAIGTLGSTTGGYTQTTPVLSSGNYEWTATSDTSGAETDLNITFPIVGSNSTGITGLVPNTVTTQGVDSITVGTPIFITTSINGTPYVTNTRSAANPASQAFDTGIALNALGTGYTFSPNGDILTITSPDQMPEMVTTSTVTTGGTNQTATNPTVVTTATGVVPKSQLDTLTFDGQIVEFSTNQATFQTAAVIASVNNYTLTTLEVADNFDIISNPKLNAGDSRIKYTYRIGGVVTPDLTTGSFVVTSGDTSGTIAIPQVIVQTQGVDESVIGTLTDYTIVLDNTVSVDDLTGTFTTASNSDSQAAQLATRLSSQFDLTATATNNIITNSFVNVGDVTDTVITYSTSGTGQTATNPSVAVTADGVDEIFNLSVWSIPYLAGSTGATGESGPQGESGFSTLTGQGDPLQTDGKNDDIYFNQINGRVWQKTNGIWVDTGNTFKGADGTPGADSIRVQVYVKDAAGVNFRNNTGPVKVLRVNVLSGGAIFTDAQHNAFTYTWYKGTTQLVSGISLREYSVSAEDVPDDGDSEYTCRVTGS